MKTVNLPVFFLFFFSVANAQTVSLSPADTSIHLNADISNEWIDFSNQIQIKNETPDTLQMYWRKVIPAECPFSWEFIIGDINITYIPTVFSNYDLNLGINFPFQLLPNQTTMGSYINLKPNLTAGCCDFSIEFFEAGNIDSVLATANIDYRINDPDCTVVSITEQAPHPVNIFPNPATSEFFIESEKEINSIEMFDLSGVRVKSYNAPPYLIEDLSVGFYFLKIEMKNGENNFYKLNKI